MAKGEKQLFTVNWYVLGQYLAKVFNALKWPVTLVLATYLIVTIPDYGSDLKINYDLVLEYIDVVIWPLVVIGAIWIIKPNLPQLLDRVEELNLFGNKAKFSKTNNQDGDTKADELNGVDANASKPATNVNNDLQIVDDEIHALLTSDAAAAAFMRVYLDIFGTQIEVLRLLVDYTDGLKTEDLTDIFEKHKRLGGNDAFNSMVTYMQYLKQNILVLYEPSTQTYKLTNAGYYFLVYLRNEGLLDRYKGL